MDARPDRFALPLAGVPVAVKDNVPWPGTRRATARPPPSTAPARRDDELVKRLRRAGAVVVGKTRMPELAVWGFTQSALGITRNPRDPARDPGGSSGGSAAAVAAGMAALALGTDGGGSIRVPAAYCGLVGLKPGAACCRCPAARTSTGSGSAPRARSPRTARRRRADVRRARGPRRRGGPAGGRGGHARSARVAVSLRSPSPLAELTAENRLAAVGAAVLPRRGRSGAGGRARPTPDPWRRTGRCAGRRAWRGTPRTSAWTSTPSSRGTARSCGTAGGCCASAVPRPATAAAWRDRVLAWFDAGRHDVLVTPAVAGPPVRAGAMRHRGYLSTTLLSASRVPYTQAWNLAGAAGRGRPGARVGPSGGGPAGGPAGRRAGAAGDRGTDRGPGGPRRPARPCPVTA